MQLAILLVLILIAVLIAPWLLGLIVVLAAAYGAWLVAVAAGTIVILGLLFFGSAILGWHRRPAHKSINRIAAESNERYRQKEAAAGRLAAEAGQEPGAPEIPSGIPIRQIHCVNCNLAVDRYSSCCSACGKNPKRYGP